MKKLCIYRGESTCNRMPWWLLSVQTAFLPFLGFLLSFGHLLCKFLAMRESKSLRFQILHVTSVPLQVLLWVLLSLLPLVEGAHVKAGAAAVGSDSVDAVGLLGGQEERELPVTLPEVVEDEEQEDDSDPYSTWHALYGT